MFEAPANINFLSFLASGLTQQVFAATPCTIMLQELYDRWTEIQKRYSERQTAESAKERIGEELNILEGLRIFGGKAIPGETSDVQVLISDRHKQWKEILRKRKG